jgi:RHS repeat-associated protein
LTKVTNNGEETLYTYDQNNNLTLSTTGSKTTEYTYNKVNSLLTLKNKVGGVEKEAYSYTYYLDGNQASKTDKNGMTSYEYDGLGRLKNETLGQNVTSYTYDNYSNRQTMQKIGQDAFNVDYNYNKNNQLIKETKNIGDNTEITNYNYDANGNMYSKQIEELKPNTNAVPSLSLGILGLNSDSKDVIYNYNNFNQLEQVVTGSTTSNYTYNANGLRASKTVNGVKTNHIWDGQNIVAETDSANVVTARYLRGRQLISRIVGTDKEYYNYNGHGDTTSLTNASGSVIIDYTYDAFGKQANVSQNDTNPFRYCGEYTDLSSGLIYLRNRYYDPNIGRFISEDPAKSGLNWYIYCHNDPINYSDPLGLDENKKLRELVAESAGSVTWDKKNKTATVKIDGKKQEYVVQPDGNVSVNGNRVGYIDSNNSIILWDNDFYRDFNIVGTVTICAYWSPDEKFFIPGTEARSDELSGHSYIEYTPLGGSTDTYSTNPAYEQYDTDNGMQKNIISDRNLMNDPNTAKYSKKITKNQEIKMFKTINDPKNDKWTYTNNCTTFAQKVFYSATNAYFGSINTPYKLKNAIN